MTYTVTITRNHPNESWRYSWQLNLDNKPVKAVNSDDYDHNYQGKTDTKWGAKWEARTALKHHRKVLAHTSQGPPEWVYILKRFPGSVESHPSFAALKARYVRDEISLEEFAKELEPLIKTD